MRAPVPNHVIVKQSKPQEMAGTIFIPEEARIRPMDGVVVAIGSGVRDISIDDKVLVEKNWGSTQTFEHEGERYWLLSQKQILARIE